MIKTTNLEISKLLKEAGFRQNTEYYYLVNKFDDKDVRTYNKSRVQSSDVSTLFIYAALTTDELLEELPASIGTNQWLTIRKLSSVISKEYSAGYMIDERWLYCRENESLPQALAQIWLILKNERLIK